MLALSISESYGFNLIFPNFGLRKYLTKIMRCVRMQYHRAISKPGERPMQPNRSNKRRTGLRSVLRARQRLKPQSYRQSHLGELINED